jgi:hypothetical protein
MNNFEYEYQEARKTFGNNGSGSIIEAILLAPIYLPMAILGAIFDLFVIKVPNAVLPNHSNGSGRTYVLDAKAQQEIFDIAVKMSNE